MTNKIGTTIKIKLIEKGWSQRRLAKEAGLSITCISKIITGANKGPNNSTMLKLCSTLGIAPADFFNLLNS